MKLLFLDTSTERGIVAIGDGEKVFFCKHLPFGLQNSGTLIPAIDEALTALGISVADLDCIAVGVGPGSYTGLRVAAVTAKTLSYARKIPLVGITSLAGFRARKGPFAAIIDAKIGGAYVMLEGGEPELVPLAELERYLKEVKVLATPKSEPLRSKMPDEWVWEEVEPDAAHLLRLAKEKFLAKEYRLDGSVELLYLRKTQAEIEREKS